MANQFRGGSPTPSASNSDHSLGPSIIKRKPIDALNPKPSKISKPTSNIDNLPFDPFNPHPGMSKEERKLARMIRNRTAAQASRDRKKEHVAELENRVRELEEQVRILSRSQSQPSIIPCLRPCCQQPPASETVDKPSHSNNNNPTQTQTHTHQIYSTISPDSIDPSIIHPKPSSPSIFPDSSPLESTPADQASLITLDPQLKTEHSSTISPAQAEYLSKVRIHVLEEENIQLKTQLDYELKKVHQLKSHLLNTTLAQPPIVTHHHHHQERAAMDEFEIDQGMIEMILKDDEIDKNLLLPSSSSSFSSSSSSSSSSSPPVPHSPSADHHKRPPSSVPYSSHHPDQLSQLSLDWDSLLLDRSQPSLNSSPTTDRPSLSTMEYDDQQDPFKMMIKKTMNESKEAQKVSEDRPVIDRLNSPDSSSVHLLQKTQPVTPSPDQQPQAPSDADLTLSTLSTYSASHHRLVAREVNELSLQRNGWEVEQVAQLENSSDLGSSGVSRLWGLAITWRRLIPILFLLGWILISERLLVIMACCLISCWVAWKNLSASMDKRRIVPRTVSLKTSFIPLLNLLSPSSTSSNNNNKKKKIILNSTIGVSSASLPLKPTTFLIRAVLLLPRSSKINQTLNRSIFIGWG